MRAISYILYLLLRPWRIGLQLYRQPFLMKLLAQFVLKLCCLPQIFFHKSFLNLYGICLRKMNKIGLGVSEIIAYFCICKVTVTVCAPANHFTSSLPYELLANTSLSNLRFFSKNLIFRRSDGTVLYEQSGQDILFTRKPGVT